MKKILFTIQWYGIPANIAASANALCDDIIINSLKQNHELEIHILSYGVSGYPLEDEIGGVFVHRFRRSKLWDTFIHTRNRDNSLYTRTIYWITRILMRIKQLLFFFSFPNYEPIHVHHFEKKAVELHKKHQFDLVISEFNGVDSLKAGVAIKKYDASVKFLPICWDSISGGRLVKWMPEKLCRLLRRRLETEVMNIADKAIIMKSSLPFHEANTKKLPYYVKFKYLDVPYLNIQKSQKDAIIVNRIGPSKFLEFLYSGTMGDRNPEYLIKILDNIGYNVHIVFITPKQYHARIQSLQKNYKNVKLDCLPYMTHEELTSYQIKSDVLINFGVSNANAVSGKIFDYMRLGKPIISTINHDNEACTPYLENYPQALIVDERISIEENCRKIIEFFAQINTSSVNMMRVLSIFESNTPEAYIKEIYSLLNDE